MPELLQPEILELMKDLIIQLAWINCGIWVCAGSLITIALLKK